MSMADDLCTLQPRETYGSRAMIELVFPSLYELLTVHFASMCALLLPDWAVRECPEVRQELYGYVVRNPVHTRNA